MGKGVGKGDREGEDTSAGASVSEPIPSVNICPGSPRSLRETA